jgi:hypothetical protein
MTKQLWLCRGTALLPTRCLDPAGISCIKFCDHVLILLSFCIRWEGDGDTLAERGGQHFLEVWLTLTQNCKVRKGGSRRAV